MRKEDPFFYYSISEEVRYAEFWGEGKSIDTNVLSAAGASREMTVARRSRLSTECYPDAMMSDTIQDEVAASNPQDGSDHQDNDDDNVEFFSYLMMSFGGEN